MSRRQSRVELGQPRLRHDCRVEQKEKCFVWRQVCGRLLPLTSLPHPDSPLLPPHFLLGCSLTPPQVWRTIFSLSHSVAFIFSAYNELSSFIILGDSAPACHGEALALEAGPKSRHSPGWRRTKTIYFNDKNKSRALKGRNETNLKVKLATHRNVLMWSKPNRTKAWMRKHEQYNDWVQTKGDEDSFYKWAAENRWEQSRAVLTTRRRWKSSGNKSGRKTGTGSRMQKNTK